VEAPRRRRAVSPPTRRAPISNPARLEERRKVKSAAYYERKKVVRKQLVDAQKSAKVDSKTKKQLAEYGY
jgi:hypothetical protein